ncbi:regulatory protein, lacI family [Pseudarthrobacter equi]|uniref:Regulatory protein, lacI family n=1 Tax=Pseudarthrobacter equi TaxID=728066 RepID=A0A1H1TJR3_9MICC|nr:LacI family DNA-binding transcriptional regulator [Pseudarthrobacter equi]SDS60487.1 regulatory protein, lacI family [Pseudarthrobacter equi]
MEPPPQLQGELVSQGKSRQLTNVTIKTVAKHAGVSTATVSRVLSGNGRVSPELQEAVRQSAEALNYSINAVAIALRSSRTATMGMIVPEIDSPAMSRLIQQVVNVLE